MFLLSLFDLNTDPKQSVTKRSKRSGFLGKMMRGLADGIGKGIDSMMNMGGKFHHR